MPLTKFQSFLFFNDKRLSLLGAEQECTFLRSTPVLQAVLEWYLPIMFFISEVQDIFSDFSSSTDQQPALPPKQNTSQIQRERITNSLIALPRPPSRMGIGARARGSPSPAPAEIRSILLFVVDTIVVTFVAVAFNIIFLYLLFHQLFLEGNVFNANLSVHLQD